MGAHLRNKEPAIDAQHTSESTALFIDCDPGMDDALALIVALKTANLGWKPISPFVMSNSKPLRASSSA